ncbi:uncharacterized protein LOC141851510 [Brevipalpus obovatus]|uniref:uncharacterized protein LOC141851510 n=1 Tax=Brevipalpus obovatus TaxID=246614 RepID=UPI003D9E9A7F
MRVAGLLARDKCFRERNKAVSHETENPNSSGMLFLTIFPFLVAISHSQIVSDSSNDTSDLPVESEREGIPEAVTISDRQEPEFDFKTFQSRSDRVWYMYCNKPTVDEEMLKEFTLCYGPQLPKPEWLKKCETDVFGEGWTLMTKRERLCLHGDETVKMIQFCIRRERLKERVKEIEQARKEEESARQSERSGERSKRGLFSMRSFPSSSSASSSSDTHQLDSEDRRKLAELLRKILIIKMKRLECMEQALQLDP